MLQGLEPIIVDTFGGLCTSIDRGDLTNGLAAVATDIEFFPGGMQSRRPFQNYLSGLAAPVTSILSYPRIDGTKNRLLLLANGTLLAETTEGSTTTVDTSLGQNLIMRGCVLANRAFVAFSDGKTPSGRPMHWNGTYFDPVGQDGPAWLVTLTDGSTAPVGDAPIGQHVSVATYVTRSGYETGPTTSSTNGQAFAGHTYSWTGLPVGPANVACMRFYISPTGDSSYFYSAPALKTSDNSGANFDSPGTGTGPFSYTDQAIASSNIPLTHARLFAWPLPPCLGIEAYNSRLVAWGALNNVPRLSFSSGYLLAGVPLALNFRSGFSNLQFDSGAVGGVPHGYQTMAAGGSLVTLAGAPTQCYKITGDGASATRGLLQRVSLSSRAITYPPGTTWRMRARLKKSAGATLGRLSIFVTGGSTPINIPISGITTEWAWYDNVLFGPTDATDNYFNIQVDNGGSTGLLQNGEWVAIDGMWVYPDTLPTLSSYLLISQPNDPETFDYQRGTLPVRTGDGQNITNCVELRGVLFTFKDRSTFGVIDNGQDPYLWPVTLVSDTVGCISPHGVARGDGWLVALATSGIFKFSGGTPDKISQEIQPTYATLNWAYKHISWAVADTEAQRIYIGIPTSGATYVNTLLVLDYVEGWGDPIASAEQGRKWSVWTPPSTPGFPCGAYIDRDNGQKTFVVGGGVAGASGYVSKMLATDPTVWGTATDTFGASTPNIMSTYDTATIGHDMTRSFFGYATAKVRGNGNGVTLSYVRPNNAVVALGTRNVSATPLYDIEWQTSQTDTQLGLRVTNQAGAVFSVKRLAAFKKPAPFAVVRGHNQ